MKWKSAATGAVIVAALEFLQWVVIGWYGLKTLERGKR
jgi:hypothetical protein